MFLLSVVIDININDRKLRELSIFDQFFQKKKNMVK